MTDIKRSGVRRRRLLPVCAVALTALTLAGCAATDIPFVKERVGEVRGPDPNSVAYPTFGTVTAPTSDKPVLDDAGQK